MDLWKKPALKLIVEVVWTADCVNQTQTQASNALTRTRTRSTHAPLSANHVFPTFNYPVRTDPLYLPIPIPSSCRFYFLALRLKPDLICEKLLLRALKHSWTYVAYRFRFLSFGWTI